MSGTLKSEEIQKFSKHADRWWDETGPFAPLHRMNPVRMHYIKDQICTRFGLDVNRLDALKGLSVLDTGCGGGLACEPLSRLGATVTGIDADSVAIESASQHALENTLSITYKTATPESLDEQYDVVLALEIIEHVQSPEEFIRYCSNLVKPGGLLILSTLNRTLKSFGLGIVAAEYILRWVPQGTHNWQSFIKPSELAKLCRKSNLTPQDATGLVYNPFQQEFSISKEDLSVNYFLTAYKN